MTEIEAKDNRIKRMRTVDYTENAVKSFPGHHIIIIIHLGRQRSIAFLVAYRKVYSDRCQADVVYVTSQETTNL